MREWPAGHCVAEEDLGADHGASDMDQDIKNYNELSEAMGRIGVTAALPLTASWPVFEGDYIKFMGGESYDKEAGDQLEAWLKSQGYSYERHRDRAIRKIQPEAVIKICLALGGDPIEHCDFEGEHLVRAAQAYKESLGFGGTSLSVWEDADRRRNPVLTIIRAAIDVSSPALPEYDSILARLDAAGLLVGNTNLRKRARQDLVTLFEFEGHIDGDLGAFYVLQKLDVLVI